MTRYAAMFTRLNARGEGALGAFLMLGDPDLRTSARLLDAVIEGGADMLEVGIPFSDPIADGPIIQASAQRALAAGVTPKDCFALLADFRARHPQIPVGILTYANLVVARGREGFYRTAAEAGVDSVLVADVPAIEADPFIRAANEAGIDPVLIVASNTPDATLRRIAALTRGYTYCVSRTGVTGIRSDFEPRHRFMLAALRDAGAPPSVLGFGISRREHVRIALSEGAAGVIVGSAIVRLLETANADPADRLRGFVASLKEASRLAGAGQAADKIMEADNVRR